MTTLTTLFEFDNGIEVQIEVEYEMFEGKVDELNAFQVGNGNHIHLSDLEEDCLRDEIIKNEY